MAILKDTILVATATLCVGSALMEIPSESKSFNKFFPYIGTFISAGIGYYFLRRSNIIKASEYQPSQEMDDYSVNEITHSSAIEGFEPLKFTVVGNRAEGLETIFDAEGAFGEKPSINFSWKAYDDNLKETNDKLMLFEEMETNKILITDATYSLKDKQNIEFDMVYPNDRTQFIDIDLRGYYDFNGGRFYLIKYDYFALKMKTKKGQPNFKVEPAYLVYYGANDYFGEWKLTLIAGASGIRSYSQLWDVAPSFNGRNSFKEAYRKLIKDNNVRHLAFNLGRKYVTNLAMRYLYFNCMTPKLELDFDESLEVASNEFGIEAFQNMIIPYSYKVKVAKEYGGKRTITNYYYVDENGDCKFFIAISIDEFGLMRFLGDNKSQLGVSDKDEDIQKGIIHDLQTLFEYRPLLKLWLKAVVMDSSNLNNRRINMWNNERSKWFKQQYEPMLYQNWMPVLYTKHKNINACNYILFMKACLRHSEDLKNDSPATVEALKTDMTSMDDAVALELFKKYFSTIQQWENLAVIWNNEGGRFEHPQFYNNLEQFKTNRLQHGDNETGVRISGANKYSIIATEKSKNTIVPISSWFNSKMPCVLPLEISNTKDLKVRAFRKIYNKYALDSLGFWIDEESAEENSYYTNKEKKLDNKNPYLSSIKEENYWDTSMLKNLFLDPHEDYKKFKHPIYEEHESESSKKPHSVTISRSSNSEKKLMAVFEDSEGKKIKTTHFGQRGASDYTKHGDKERMERYLERHGGGTTTSTKEDWKDPTTAGALSRWILWNKPSLSASFSDYKSRFGLKGTLNVSKSAEERKCKSCEKPATIVVQEGSFCYECLPINLGAETFEATEWVGFCPECNKWRTKDMSIKIDDKITTNGWSIPDKLLGKRLCKKGQRFGRIRQSGDSFTGYGSRPFDYSYCGTPLTKVKSKYKAEYKAKSPAQDSLDEWNDKKWKTKSAKYRASEQNNAYSQFGIDDKISNKEPPMIFIQSYDHDHNGDEMLDNIIYNNYTLVSYAMWFKYKVARTWKGLEGFDIKLIPLTENSYKIVILMKGKSLYQNKLWKLRADYDYEGWPFKKSPQGSSMGYDHDAEAGYVGFRFYVEPDTIQAEQYEIIWDAYEQSNNETFEAKDGSWCGNCENADCCECKNAETFESEYTFLLYVKEGTEGYGEHGMYHGNTDEIPPNATIEEIVESIVQVAIDSKAIKSFQDIEFLGIENPDEERIYEYDTDPEEGDLKVWFAEGENREHCF